MQNFTTKDPVIPYYGNTLDNEIIASNMNIIDEDIVMKHQFNTETKIVIEDSIMASTITDDQIDFSFETITSYSPDYYEDVSIEDEDITWED